MHMCSHQFFKSLAAIVCLFATTVVVNAAPGAFTITSPGNTTPYGPFWASPSVVFQWSASSGAASYQLNVRAVTLSDTGLVTQYPVNSTTPSITISSLTPGHQYKSLSAHRIHAQTH